MTKAPKISGVGTVTPFEIRPGDIVLVNNHKGILPKLIRFVTGSVWSHTAVGFFPLYVSGDRRVQQVFEANLVVHATSWANLRANPDLDIRVYRLDGLDTDAVEEVMATMYLNYNGSTYGWGQLPWFIFRRALEILHLPRRWAIYNWFPKGRICTGVTYDFLMGIRDSCIRHTQIALFRSDLNYLRPQSLHPKDVERIMDFVSDYGAARIVYAHSAGAK